MAEKKSSSLRRRAFHAVIVLLVFYPLAVYLYTRSINQATTQHMILKNIKGGIDYCFEVKSAVEALLTRTKGPRFGYDPLERAFGEPDVARFQQNLQRLLHSSDAAATQVRFTGVYDGNKQILRWGQDPTDPVVHEIEVNYPIDYEVIRKDVYEAATRQSNPGICRINIPLDLGTQRPARLVVGLVSPDSGSQLAQLSEKLSSRALRLSLLGTSMLALLAAYIVYLNDRTRELEFKLEHEKRLAYVGTIAAGMAHEIRNPLSSVKMNIQMIEVRLNEIGESESGYLATKVARIHHETARLEESVNNFLAFARPKPLQRRWVNLNEAVDHVIEFLEPACSSDGTRIVRDYTPGLPEAYIDPEQFGQAVENLVRNAAQAVGKGGVIEVFTGLQDHDLEIRVSDNGPGIPAAAKDRLFEIFFTTKQGGTGLGLTIVKQIVEAHDGTVTFDTIEKQGATFSIRLPIGKN